LPQELVFFGHDWMWQETGPEYVEFQTMVIIDPYGMRPSIYDDGKFLQFLTPTPLSGQFFLLLSIGKIGQYLTPSPSKKYCCLKWMVPMTFDTVGVFGMAFHLLFKS
jgi:hypothetical protein